MKRRAYALLVAVAIVMGLAAIFASLLLGEGLKDPDGSLGPSYVRLPMMVLGAFLIDVVPRSLWRSRRRLRSFPSQAKSIIDEHWTRERIALVVIGLVSLLRHLRQLPEPQELPAAGVRHQDLRPRRCTRSTSSSSSATSRRSSCTACWARPSAAHVLAIVYLLFLPISPLSLIVYLVWSRNIS